MTTTAAVPDTVAPAGLLQLIPLEQLHESPFNKRRTWGDLEELAASIREVGVLEPLCARKNASGFELVFGHRRFRAATKAGIATVPVLQDMLALVDVRVTVRELERRTARERLLAEGWARDQMMPTPRLRKPAWLPKSETEKRLARRASA